MNLSKDDIDLICSALEEYADARLSIINEERVVFKWKENPHNLPRWQRLRNEADQADGLVHKLRSSAL